jgi:membrane peptidoglycan carboxypeptidase
VVKTVKVAIVAATILFAIAFFGIAEVVWVNHRLPETTSVSLKNVAPYMVQALLAAEDHHFYEHNGVDSFGLIRATIDNWKAGHMVEGGSTITQQLVKNVFLDWRDRTALRKFKEWIIAWELERHYSKEKILESYLNCVYFGNGAYGIEPAAKTYFGVSAGKLTIAQSAFLAALLKAPSNFGAPSNEALAFARQKLILQNMVQYGYITLEQERRAENEKLIVIPCVPQKVAKPTPAHANRKLPAQQSNRNSPR